MRGFLRHRVKQSDTLRGLAVFYLGDHKRWVDLAIFNDLQGAEFHDLTGIKELRIPIEVGPAGDPNDPFLRDLAVKDGGLVLSDQGNLRHVGGVPNLVASLLRALTTEVGALLPHQAYGFQLRKYVGFAGTVLFHRFLRLETERVIRRDPRVADVKAVRVRQLPETRRVEIAADVLPVGTEDLIELIFERSAPN